MQKIIYLVLLTFLTFTRLTAQNDTLIVGYAYAPPFISTQDSSLEGTSVWLWNKIAEDHKINTIWKELPFEEIPSALEKGEIDVCINPLTITAERSKKFQFTQPFYISNSAIAMHNPGRIQKFMGFMKSLISPQFLSGIIFLSVIIFFFGWLTWRVERKHNPEHFRHGREGLLDGIWWSVVTMTTVGYGDKFPTSKWGRLIALTWMFVAVIFVSGLTASIASSLTISKIVSSQSTFEELNNKKVGTIANTTTTEYLRRKNFRKVTVFPHVDDGLKAIVDGKIKAFLYDSPILSNVLANSNYGDDLYILPVKFGAQLYAWGVKKSDFELTDRISKYILEETESLEWELVLRENGLEEF